MNIPSLIALLVFAFGVSACGGEDRPAAPEEAAASHETGHIELTTEQIAAAGLGIAQAEAHPIRDVLPLYGVVAPNAERVLDVTARYPGLIRTVTRKMGDTVRQGDTLATVESDESLRTYDVVAPLSGVITARNANAGEQTGGRALFTVADLSSVWVEVSLFPRDAAKVKVGQRVRITSSDSDLAGEGGVIYVAPFGTSSSQTLSARVLLDNADRRWAPGLYVAAEVSQGEQLAAVAIRNEALQTLAQQNVVFVQNEHGFEARVIRVGRTDGEYSEVLAGLQAGERYVTHNSFILKAELGKGEAAHED